MKKITAYKGFDKNLRCKDFQYEVGKTYHHTGEIKMCNSGFHSCLNPLDALNYYTPISESRYCEVEIWGAIDKSTDDSKVVSEYIFIKRELTLKELIEVYIKKNIITTNKSFAKNTSNEDYSQNISNRNYIYNASSGNYTRNISNGDMIHNANSGDNSYNINNGNNTWNANSGGYTQNINNGNNICNASSGCYNYNINNGNNIQEASSGNRSYIESNGNNAKNVSSGDYTKMLMAGKNNVGVAIGKNSIISGVVGSWITLAEYDENDECICVKSAKIDGIKLKEYTWYILKDGEFVKNPDYF